MAPIDWFLSAGTRRRRLFQAVLAVAYGQRGIHFSRNGSISSPNDLAIAWSIDLRDSLGRWLEQLIPVPEMFPHSNLVRVGSSGDGGYWILSRIPGAVISAGTSGNDSFDLDLAHLGARVLQIDNSQDTAPSTSDRLRFIRGTVGVATDELNLDRLVEMHQMNFGDVDQGARWLLKMDIEGSEWEILANAKDLSRWDQIVVEFHDLHEFADQGTRVTYETAIANLTRQHLPIAIHGNSCCGFSILAGIPIPQVLEVSFAKIGEGASLPLTDNSHLRRRDPYAWSQTNVPGRADLWLWGLSPDHPNTL